MKKDVLGLQKGCIFGVILRINGPILTNSWIILTGYNNILTNLLIILTEIQFILTNRKNRHIPNKAPSTAKWRELFQISGRGLAPPAPIFF